MNLLLRQRKSPRPERSTEKSKPATCRPRSLRSGRRRWILRWKHGQLSIAGITRRLCGFLRRASERLGRSYRGSVADLDHRDYATARGSLRRWAEIRAGDSGASQGSGIGSGSNIGARLRSSAETRSIAGSGHSIRRRGVSPGSASGKEGERARLRAAVNRSWLGAFDGLRRGCYPWSAAKLAARRRAGDRMPCLGYERFQGA